MSRKDFQLVAAVLASFEGRSNIASPELVASFSDVFCSTFTSFDPEKFEAAAQPQETAVLARLEQLIT